MSIEFKAAPAKDAALITATAFFTDAACSTAPAADSTTWGLEPFKTASSYSALAADTQLGYQKYVDANTPYITAMTGTEIHVVKQASATDAAAAAAAKDDALWKLTYTASAKDTICVKFDTDKYIQHKLVAGVWGDKAAAGDAEKTDDKKEGEGEEEKKEEEATTGAKSMGAAFAAAALAVAATQF